MAGFVAYGGADFNGGNVDWNGGNVDWWGASDSGGNMRGGDVYPALPIVYVRQLWADDWTWVPWLFPTTATDVAPPNVSECQLDWRFGEITQPSTWAADIYPFMNLNGWYVKIDVVDPWGIAPCWIGVIEVDTIRPHGTVGYPAGRQTLTAYGLANILDRRPIRGSWSDISDVAVFVERPFKFNSRSEYGQSYVGNRSAAIDAGTGAYFFKNTVGTGEVPSDVDKWTNRDIVEYIITYYVNAHPDSGSDGPAWYLTGQTDALDKIIGEYNIDGMTPLQAIGKLIDRRRGLGWRVVSDSQDATEIQVYSLFTHPVNLGNNEVIPSNTTQVSLDITLPRMTPTINIRDTSRYDVIVVEGAPIVMCSTFGGPAAATYGFEYNLVQGWTAAEQTSYLAITGYDADVHDALRTRDLYGRVFQTLLVAGDWNWTFNSYVCNPAVDDFGNIDSATTSAQQHMRRFLSWLPIVEPAADARNPEYRRPFAVVYLTETSDFTYVNRASLFGFHNGQLEMNNQDLGITVRQQIPHVAASSHVLTGETNIDPEYNWERYLLTAAYELDTTLNVRIQVPGGYGAETGRVKLIRDPEAQCWIVIPGTILDTDSLAGNGLSVYAGDAVVRNDRAQLFAKANLAAAWYSQQRASLNLVWKGISIDLPVGTMVAGIIDAAGYTAVGTVVSSRSWSFDRSTTTINTAYQELDL